MDAGESGGSRVAYTVSLVRHSILGQYSQQAISLAELPINAQELRFLLWLAGQVLDKALQSVVRRLRLKAMPMPTGMRTHPLSRDVTTMRE
jgi:hypothetical protein